MGSANATTRLSGFLNLAFEKFRIFILIEAVQPFLVGFSLKLSVIRLQPRLKLSKKFCRISEKAGET